MSISTILFFLTCVLSFCIFLIHNKIAHDTRTRVIALVLFTLFAPLSYFAIVSLKGAPQQMEYSNINRDEVEIISVHLNFGKNIYIWVIPRGSDVPVSLELAWSEELGGFLMSTMIEANQRNMKFVITDIKNLTNNSIDFDIYREQNDILVPSFDQTLKPRN